MDECILKFNWSDEMELSDWSIEWSSLIGTWAVSGDISSCLFLCSDCKTILILSKVFKLMFLLMIGCPITIGKIMKEKSANEKAHLQTSI